jgi:hypothetical protein
MGVNEFPQDEDNHVRHPWSELGKLPRRETLVKNLLYTRGITTLVAPPGWGKTTLAASVAFAVDAGEVWDDEETKTRPLVWIAGEDEEGLQAVRDARAFKYPGAGDPQGHFYIEPFDLYSADEANRLIKDLEGMPPALVVADTLADMLGGHNEDKTQDMLVVYENVRRVVRTTNATFLLLHHTGRNTERSRGSIVIDAKSDIVVPVTEFNGQDGYIKLKHTKRRGGRLLEFAYAVELVPVYANKDPVPLIMGRSESIADVVVPSQLDKDMALMEAVLRSMDNSATSGAWQASLHSITAKGSKGGWSKATFNRNLQEFKKRHPELTRGPSQGDPYSLSIQPTVPMVELVKELVSDPLQPVSVSPLVKGGETGETGLEGVSAVSKPVSENDETGSSQGRAEGERPTSAVDKVAQWKGAEALRQTAELFEKAKAKAEASAKTPKPVEAKKPELW